MAFATGGRLGRVVATGAPVFLLGGAYLSQYGFGLVPCEMCWWQRYALFAAVVLGVSTWLKPVCGLLWLAALALAASSAIGGFHAGVEYGWWEGLTACTIAPGTAGGDPLAAILDAKVVRCDVAPWSLAGISLAGWNFLFSGAAALAIVLALWTSRGSRERL